jgi:hypothetical protein
METPLMLWKNSKIPEFIEEAPMDESLVSNQQLSPLIAEPNIQPTHYWTVVAKDPVSTYSMFVNMVSTPSNWHDPYQYLTLMENPIQEGQ